MTLAQLIRIVWARRWQFVSVCLVVIALVVVASLVLPKKYAVETAVVVNTSNSDPLNESNANNQAPQLQPSFIATQMDVISSHNVALKVVDREKLIENDKLKTKFAEATHNQGSLRDWIADALLDSLNVRSSHNGNVIYIQYSSTSPELSAAVAEAFAQCYLQTILELRVDPARRQSGWFEQQLKDLRSTLELAQQKLSTYQKDHGIIGTDDVRLDVENARLEELSKQLVGAQSSMYGSVAREHQMNDAAALNRPDELSDVLKSPLLQNLKTELARAEANFAEISQRFDHNHPQYLSAQAQLTALQKKVALEIDNTRATVLREASISRQQSSDLQKAVEQQRARILSLQHTQDEYSVLKRDAENARTAYDNAMQRSGETKLESRLDQANAAILNHAVVPVLPSSPRLLLNLVIAVLFSPLLAVGVCLAAEMSNRRVHASDDLIFNGYPAVLVDIPSGHFGLKTQSTHPPYSPSSGMQSKAAQS